MNLYLNSSTNDGPTWNKRDYLLRAARRLGFDWVLPLKGVENPDLVLNIEPYQKFIAGKLWTGLWEIDLALDRPELSQSDWVAADDVFIAVSTYPDKMKCLEHKTKYLPQACDPEVHRRIPVIKQEFDFVFSGSCGLDIYRERERLISLLRKHFSFADFGKNHPPQEYIGYLNQARVQFIRSGKTPIVDSWTAQRFFECLPIGPVLTDWTVDLAKLGLVENIDYLSYKSDDELMSKFEVLVKSPDYAEYVAKNGREKALLYHTYEHRLISIINVIKDHGIRIIGSA